MAATVTVRRWTGASGAITKTDVSGITSLGNWDDAHFASAPTYPIQIPSAGTNYSWWATFGLSADTTPATSISNLKFYTDGTSGFFTNVALKAQTANVGADSGYRQAVGTDGTTTANQTGKALADSAKTLTAATAAASVATFTTSAAHGYSIGDIAVVAGVTPSGYNGTWTVASTPTSTTFTANIGSTPAAGSAFGTSTKLFYTGLTTTPVDAFTFTSGSPKTMTGSIANPSTGSFGDLIVLQLEVPSTVTQTGSLTVETMTISYDES